MDPTVERLGEKSAFDDQKALESISGFRDPCAIFLSR